MPELPEVETITQQLHKEFSAMTIGDVWFDEEKFLRPNSDVFIPSVVGREVRRVTRRGKWIVFELNGDLWLIAHLKLTGRMLLGSKKNYDPYVHVKLGFTQNKVCSLHEATCQKELHFSDARKFGYFEILDRQGFESKFKSLGKDFLKIDREEFLAALKRSKRNIKTALLDQEIFSGIGNIYANDGLWLARVNPHRRADTLNKEELEKLHNALVQVLHEGLAYNGASDNWYRDLFGKMGAYQEHFKVYNQKGQSCQQCGSVIMYTKIAARGTYYCLSCQI